MMNPYWGGGWGGGDMFGFLSVMGPFFIVAILWSLVWKGLALWHAAGRNEPIWFVILLVVNTLGVLEIVYLFLVAKLKFDQLFSKHHSH